MSRLARLVRGSPALYEAYRRFRMWLARRRYRLRHVHPTFFIGWGCEVSPDLVAGPYSFVNRDCIIYPGVRIGAYVMLGPRVAVVGQDHRYDIPGTPIPFSGRPVLQRTVIEDDAWIGYGVIISTGVRIGRGAIVAAGSVVTRDVEPYEIVAGVPARKIRDRFPDPGHRQQHDAMLSEPPRRGQYPEPRFVRELEPDD